MLMIEILPPLPDPYEASEPPPKDVTPEWPELKSGALPRAEAVRAVRRRAWRAALLAHVQRLGALLLILHLGACAVGTRRRAAVDPSPSASDGRWLPRRRFGAIFGCGLRSGILAATDLFDGRRGRAPVRLGIQCGRAFR